MAPKRWGMLFLLIACLPPPQEGPEDTSSDTGDVPPPPAECPDVASAPAFALVHGAFDGEVAVPWYDPVGGEAGVVVLSAEGCVLQAVSAGLYPSAARWSGDDLWFNQMGATQALHRVASDGTVETVDTPRAHHDFVVHPDGTLAWLEEVVRTIDGVAWRGDIVQERAPDGTLREVWSAFDRLPLTTNERCAGQDPIDWTHANGMAATADGYLVSLYCTAQVVEIDRATGQTLRTLDGADVDSPFGPQHAPSASADGVRLFDNAGPEGGSRLLEASWEGETLGDWNSDDGLETPVFGDLLQREDGVRLASFGAEGVVLAVDGDGAEIWRVEAPGMVLGRVDWRP